MSAPTTFGGLLLAHGSAFGAASTLFVGAILVCLGSKPTRLRVTVSRVAAVDVEYAATGSGTHGRSGSGASTAPAPTAAPTGD